MVHRPQTLSATLVAASLVLAACSGGAPDEPATTDPTQGATTSALSPPDEDTSPDAPRPTSAMTIEDVAPPMSDAEIRVAEIIVEFDGEVTDEGTVLTLDEPILFDFDSAELKPSSGDASRLTAEGRGSDEPVAPNEHDDGADNPDGRAQNRRVEVLVVGVEPPEGE